MSKAKMSKCKHQEPQKATELRPQQLPSALLVAGICAGMLIGFIVGLGSGILISWSSASLSDILSLLSAKSLVLENNVVSFDMQTITESLSIDEAALKYNSVVGPGRGRLHTLFQTSILHINICALVGASGFDLGGFNKHVAAGVLAEHRSFSSKMPSTIVEKSDTTKLNSLFYLWQVQGQGWDNLFNRTAEVQQLAGLLQGVADNFLRRIGGNEDVIQNRDRENISAWGTVHNNGQEHLLHSHPDALVSAVYYARMPSNSGTIAFSDPRGPLPPFDSLLQIRPQPGDIVMFPSWLAHQVKPTGGDSERISLAFNFPGKWSDTTFIDAVADIGGIPADESENISEL